MNLIDTQDRGKLAEGRNRGIGFAFCKREGDTYTTIMPLTACKDFLNDVVWSEATGKPYSIYGLNSKRDGILADGNAYVVLGILPTNRTALMPPNHPELEKALMTPETGLESFLSHFEKAMGIKTTSFAKIAPNRILATLDGFWAKATYRISLWSLLVRVGLKYKEGDPMAFLNSVNDDDGYMVKSIIPKINRMMAGDIPEQDLAALSHPHSVGIQTFQFPIK